MFGGAADHIASALGAGLVSPGDVLLKFGGAVDILVASDGARPTRASFSTIISCLASSSPNGCMATGGSALNWFARKFACGEAPGGEEAGLSIHHGSTRSPRRVPPAATGLASALFSRREDADPRRRTRAATFDGLTLSHDIGHLWRALLEAYAYALAHHIEV